MLPGRATGYRSGAPREDRILQEIHATGGDVRRICDLFGLSVDCALRYANTIAQPDLDRPYSSVSRTRRSQQADDAPTIS